MIFEFYGKYDLGIAQFDKQHLAIFNFFFLFESCKRKKFKIDIAVGLLREMIDLAASHFEDEENILEEYGYENLGKHKKEHERLLVEINSFTDKFEIARKPVGEKDISFLMEWLEKHLLDDDMEFKTYLKEHGVT